MNNKNILTDKLGEIDSEFLDEYHDRRSRRKFKKLIKDCSIAASVMIVIAVSTVILLPAFSNTPSKDPVDTSNGVIDNGDYNKDRDDCSYTVIYADEKDDGSDFTVEVESISLQPGEVRLGGGLYEILKSDEPYENTLFAVRISFGSDYTDDAFATHAEAFIESLESVFKNVKIVWSDDPENANESTEVWEVRFTYLTKEELASIEAPDDLGIELSLIPQWMDTGEEVIYAATLD